MTIENFPWFQAQLPVQKRGVVLFNVFGVYIGNPKTQKMTKEKIKRKSRENSRKYIFF
jgi:hypothetical protein